MRSRLRHSHLALLFALLGVCLTAQGAGREAWSQVRSDAIRSHVEFLASDLLEGRAAASRGYDIAAAYVAAQFRQCGLTPAGTNSFYQTVPLLEATAVLPGSAAELVVDGDTHSFEYSTDYLPSADFMSASSTLSAPMTFAGYGIAAPELGHDDFANLDLQGRIAVIFSGAPASFPHHQRAYFSSSTTKYESLIAHGAVGVVIIDSPQDARRTPWERSAAMSWTPQMRWVDQSGKAQQTFEQLKLRFRFNEAAATRLFKGADRDFDSVRNTIETATVPGFPLPGLLTLSATTGLRRTESVNVIAVLPGSDPKLKHEYIVISAHLDHLGRGSAVNGDAIYNGAHDNAIGIGIMLELARALQLSNTRPRRSVIFAALTAEEKGLLGSDYFAKQPPLPQGDVLVANINLDMPMLFAHTADLIAMGEEHSTLGSAARSAAVNEGYRLSPDPAPEEVAFIRSDQFSFIRQGIPAIVLGAGQESRDSRTNAAELQREFRAKHYHQPTDDLSLPMDFEAAAGLARVDLRLLLEIANAPTRPAWKAGDFFAGKFPVRAR
jgi:hypothetical protein